MTRFVTAREAAGCIASGSTLWVSGFLGYGSPEELLTALRERYDESYAPTGLTLFKGISIADRQGRGTDRIALPGLIDRLICAHIGVEPGLQDLVASEACLAYMLPFGTVTELLRATSAGRPGVLTQIGLGTFADPRQAGSKANRITEEKGEDRVQLLTAAGDEYLFYPSIPIDVCFIRATHADEAGNLSVSREGVNSDLFEAAAATRASGGLVIAQVEAVLPAGSLKPRDIYIHNFMVDMVVEASPENHRQSYACDEYRHELSGEKRIELSEVPPLGLSLRKVCGRRALIELPRGALVNLGIGMPEAVASVAAEEGVSADITLSIESGVLGGVPLSGLGLGGAVNPEAIYRTADILNIYDGGGLDAAVLGLAEMDELGNVNVSSFGGRVVGPGGFIDISQPTKNVIFMGTFTAGGLKAEIADGKLRILEEGRSIKFKKRVEQITFSGALAMKNGHGVTVVTERAVFRLTEGGLLLTETAPGIDLERDILALMEFHPLVSPELREMDAALFAEGVMGIGSP